MSDEKQDAYTVEYDEGYQMLIGPDNFRCFLTEPEDRTFYRDLKPLVELVNAQHAELVLLKDTPPVPKELLEWIHELREGYESIMGERHHVNPNKLSSWLFNHLARLDAVLPEKKEGGE